MPTDLIGLTFGSYKLVEMLGRGGMATVYRGYQESIDRSVAVKVLPPEFLHDPSFSVRFKAEARTLAKLTHPAILPLYDFGAAHDVPYIVMPLMAGGTLADLSQRGPLSLFELVRVLTPIADALDFAHASGVIHRDIKPSNILFDNRRQPFLADFGIAKAIEASSNLTGTGIIGTPDYMSPEQARGETVDGRSDLYSLGVMAYQCLAGDLLFKATTPIGVLLMHASEPPPPIRQKRSDIPAGVEAALIKALAKRPEERYQTGREFMQVLTTGAGGAAVQPPIVVPPGPTIGGQPVRPASGSMTGGPLARPATGPMTAPPPVKAPTVETAPPPRRGFSIGGVLIGGGLGAASVIGGIVLLIACCVGAVILSPEFTATATPPPTVTPTPEPTQVAYLLVDTYDNPATDWETGNDNASDIGYVDGQYAIHVFETGWIVSGSAPKATYSNISVQVNGTYAGGNYKDILFGVMCNFQDNRHFYYLGIDTSGSYAIGKLDGTQETILTGGGQPAFSKDLAQGTGWFRLNVDCASNGQLTLFVDGIQIATANDTAYPSGNIALFAYTFAPATGKQHQPAQVQIHFDDLTVTQLP